MRPLRPPRICCRKYSDPAGRLMTYLNPPNPLFKGAHQAFVRTGARGHRFAVLRPASDDALLIPLIPLICKNYLSGGSIPFSTVLSISPGRAASPDSILLQ